MIYRIHTIFIEYQVYTIHLFYIQPKKVMTLFIYNTLRHKLC